MQINQEFRELIMVMGKVDPLDLSTYILEEKLKGLAIQEFFNFQQLNVFNINIDKYLIDCLNKKIESYSIEKVIDLFFYIQKSSIKFNDMLDDSVNELIVSLLDIKQNDKLLDLCCGFTNIFKEIISRHNDIKDTLSFNGIEINSIRAYQASLILTLLNVNNSIKQDDALTCDIENFTKAIVMPPLGLTLNRREHILNIVDEKTGLTSRSSLEWLFVNKLVEKLDDNKKIVALVSNGALFKETDKEYRKYLVENNYIETIIELPSNIMMSTGISFNLIVISNNNKYINIIDSNKYLLSQEKGRLKKIDNDKIIEDLLFKKIKRMRNEELLNEDSIIPSILLCEEVNIKFPVNIVDVSQVLQGSQYTSKNFENEFQQDKDNYKILTSGDIDDGIILWDNLKKINADKKLDKHLIQKNDLIMTSKSSKVKIAVVDTDLNDKIVVTGGMLIIRPNTNAIEPLFIKMFLESSKGQTILKKIQKGSIITTITLSSLRTIQLSCPPLEVQKNYTMKYFTCVANYSAVKQQLSKIESRVKNYFDDEVDGEL